MISALKKLSLNEAPPLSKIEPGKKGFKKAYFLACSDLIFDLVETKGLKYPMIIEAIKDDGVTFNYQYFRELMAAEKRRRKDLGGAPKAAATAPSVPQNTTGGKPANETKRDEKTISTEKAEYIAEVEAIKNDTTLTLKQKRDKVMDAELRFSKTLRLRG